MIPQDVVSIIFNFKKEFERLEYLLMIEQKHKFDKVLDEIIKLPIILECPNCNKIGSKRYKCCLNIYCIDCGISCFDCKNLGCEICIDLTDTNQCDYCIFQS